MPNVQWKTPDDGQRNCPKHVEFLDKNKFGKISASVGFIKKILFCNSEGLVTVLTKAVHDYETFGHNSFMKSRYEPRAFQVQKKTQLSKEPAAFAFWLQEM
jgi:hypothetical protein